MRYFKGIGNWSLRQQVFFSAWFILQLLPYFVTHYWSDLHIRFFPFDRTRNLYALLLTIPWLLVVQALGLQAAVALVRCLVQNQQSIWRRWAAFTLKTVLFTILILYHALIAGSWYFFLHSGNFIGSETLALAPFLFDWSYCVATFGALEISLIVLFLISATVIALFFYRYSSKSQVTSRGFLKPLFLLCPIFLFSMLLTQLPKLWMDDFERNLFATNVPYAVSPEYSLLWSSLFYRTSREEIPPINRPLIPRQESPVYSASTNRVPFKKDIIIFVVEGLRADVVSGSDTAQKAAPVMNQLAKEGFSFTNAHAQAPETSESMLTIFASLYPLKFPRRDLRHDVSYPITRIYDILQEFGYRTGYFAEEWSMDRAATDSPGLSMRFDPTSADLSSVPSPLNPYNYKNRGLGNYSLAVADQLKIRKMEEWLAATRNDGAQALAVLYFIAPHFPYDQYDGVVSLFVPNELPKRYSFFGYLEEATPQMWNRYLNTINYIDSLVGQFVTQRKELGLLDQTMLIITGDHGQMFNEHGQIAHSRHLYEEALRVPLVFWGVGSATPCEGLDIPVGHIDVAPTLLELLNLPRHPSFQGKNILARNSPTGTDPLETRPLFASVQAFTHEDAVISWPWKYTKNHWGERARLYNLAIDPEEHRNQVSDQVAVTQLLDSCLSDFRRTQLAYYSRLYTYRDDFFPPKYDTCTPFSK